MTDKPKSESLTKRYRRTLSRLSRLWKGEPVRLEDINVIKLPATWKAYAFGDEYSYFATRAEGDKWNVEAQKNWGGEYLQIQRLASGLDLPAALNLMAEHAPESMKRETGKYWHPVYVASLIGHQFPTAEAAPRAPKLAG